MLVFKWFQLGIEKQLVAGQIRENKRQPHDVGKKHINTDGEMLKKLKMERDM